jgi:hypothetical protein
LKFVYAFSFVAAAMVAQPASAQSGVSRAVPPDAVAFAAVARAAPEAASATSRPIDQRQVSLPAVPAGLRTSAALPPAEIVAKVQPEAERPKVAPVVAAPRTTPVRVARGGDLDRDVRCLAQAVFHEARGEPLRGQRAVADVIMNRARSGRWGSGACAVVDAPSQFSNRWSWRTPQLGVDAWDRAIDIARDAVAGAVSVSGKLMNFRSAGMGAARSGAMRIGRHVFW